MHNVLCIYLLHKNEHQMNKYRKIYHATLEVNGTNTRYYLVISEICIRTNNVIGSYTVRLPDLVAENENPDYQYYQPIFN